MTIGAPIHSAEEKQVITRWEVLQNQECPPELEGNLSKLLFSLNKFRLLYGIPMLVSSGLRSPQRNAAVGGSPTSAHLTCEACDFTDSSGDIKKWVLANPTVLEECGLYAEDFGTTTTWIHLTIRAPKSGSRIFKP